MDMEYERYRYDQASSYLNYVKTLSDRVNAKNDAVEDYRARLACIRGMDYSAEKIQVQSSGDAIPEGIARLLELIDECTDLTCKYAKEQKRAMEVIGNLSRYEYEQILEKHYLRNKDWGTIASEMNYTYHYVMRLRREAIVELYDYVPCEFRDKMQPAL